MNRLGFQIEMTCGACPEQYDLYLNDMIVGYFRLRHGYYTVSYPDVGGDIVYRGHSDGDGIFLDDERERELNNGIDAIISRMVDEDLIILVGCYECKEERYTTITDSIVDSFIPCFNCSPNHPKFHYIKEN